jgi:hypothetical protein
MRYILLTLGVLGFATPVMAGHEAGVPPGQAAKNGIDRNMDGKKDGKDYAPGQSAKASDRRDVNGDGKINGKDYASGQNKN